MRAGGQFRGESVFEIGRRADSGRRGGERDGARPARLAITIHYFVGAN